MLFFFLENSNWYMCHYRTCKVTKWYRIQDDLHECQINDLCMKMHLYVRRRCRVAKSYADTTWINECFASVHAVFVIQCVHVFNRFRFSGSAMLMDGLWSLYWLSHTCQMWQSSEVNSQGHRGEELKAGCDDFLALAQPSTSAHQHISVVKGARIVHNGSVREC